ncbi:hypothetical protein CaCOL14_012922 [Colletotrichum acutatum]
MVQGSSRPVLFCTLAHCSPDPCLPPFHHQSSRKHTKIWRELAVARPGRISEGGKRWPRPDWLICR